MPDKIPRNNVETVTIADDRYETLVQLSPDALYVLQDGQLVFINAAGARQLRAPDPETLLGLPMTEILHPDYLEKSQIRVAEMVRTGLSAPLVEQKYMRRDGTVIDVEVCSAPFLYEGRPAIQVIARTITDRKLVEEALRRSHDTQLTLTAETTRAKDSLLREKAILEMIALDKPLAEILREVCFSMERVLSGEARCLVLLLQPDNVHLRVGAAPSLPEQYSSLLQGMQVGSNMSPCINSIFWNKQVIVEDIEGDPSPDHDRDSALANGLRACWATPIRAASGVVLGSFGVYYSQPRSPAPEDLASIFDIIDLVGIALHKEKVERSLQQSEERYRSVVTSLTEGIVLQSRDGVVLACNPSAERILHIQPEYLVGMKRGSHFVRIVGEDGLEIPRGEWPSERVLRTGVPMLGVVVGLEMSDGEIVWISENVLPLRNPGESEPSSVLLSFSDITAVKDAQQRLQFMATHDSLTELPNRTCLIERLSSALDSAREKYRQVAILFLDLDRFKNVNDTLGHEAGDRLLKMVAGRLASCIRGRDTLARLGGDEFVVLVDSFDDAFFLATLSERILQAISEPFHIDDNEYYLGVSIGISVFPDDGQDGPTLLRCADSAMYHAKECGRNHYQFFTTHLSVRAQRRYLLEKNLRRALAQQEFVLHYQAKVDLETCSIVGAEALLRWDNPDIGLVPPNDFIPTAEETGLIVPIGKWVLEQACRQAVQWRAGGNPDLRIAVNLSPRQFQDEHLVDVVTDILERTGLPPHALELEITESLLIGDTEKLLRVFDAMTALGVNFALDDFGTGYSSLSYLQRFPIRTLKIDRSFIHGIPGNRDSVALTQAIIGMAHALEMTVTAEGVEQKAQMDFLKQAGCQEMQGFYFSKPLTAEAFEVSLRKS